MKVKLTKPLQRWQAGNRDKCLIWGRPFQTCKHSLVEIEEKILNMKIEAIVDARLK